MHSLLPTPPDGTPPSALSDDDLAGVYAYPDSLTRPWIQANFVSSADGAATVAGVSEALSHPADRRVFLLGRELADVVLVGAGTVRAEDYRGVRATGRRRERRLAAGLTPVPPIAVVSARCAIDPGSRLLTDTEVPPIVLTTASAPQARRRALTAAGADVVVLGERVAAPSAIVDELARRRLFRVDCEGGPGLFGGLVAADLVDQLCLTVSPVLAGAGPGRIVSGVHGGAAVDPRRMELASLLHEDGYTMFRYRRTGGR
ncbi:hypothetical protein CFN78_21610 [Amycolatopsis antarctica]|uniref:Bacterial bifunctional deaminase-reductase C-terminal domain-containing protein n=1 Tax=Amycolatopsis antarctica TaxID=1854586 RepID=A0A263CY45_9PSEU|nr:pyrimidine reductase family protein [Amycolatopsis antarctica]OZM71074.1 hypothetical protein CFN78_21610 [Amycolatopsis antarctica]